MKKCPYCQVVNAAERVICFKCEKPFEDLEDHQKIEPLKEEQHAEVPEQKPDLLTNLLDYLMLFGYAISILVLLDYSDDSAVYMVIFGPVFLAAGTGMAIHRHQGRRRFTRWYSWVMWGFLLVGLILVLMSLKMRILWYFESL